MIRDFLVRTMDDFHLRPVIEKLIGKRSKYEYSEFKNKKKIFFVLMPTYGNLGDQAIAAGSLLFLKKFFADYEIIRINLKDTYKKIYAIKEAINFDDIIILQGGGNMGNLYQYIENYRRAVIKEFFNYKIISMPVTVTFTHDKNGRKELRRSQQIYKKCKDLTIIAREEKSYQFLKKYFNTVHSFCSPDMAFYLVDSDLIIYNEKRQGILLCLRHDWEMIDTDVEKTVSEIFNKFDNCRIYDTYVTRDISHKMRNTELKAALREFAMSELVITNRLHAMVMAALTKTPCIVTGALDWKISGTYKWISRCPYISFVDELNVNSIEEAKNSLLYTDTYNLKEEVFEKFSDLAKDII